MAFLGPADRELLTDRFEKELSEPVRLVLFIEPKSSLYLPGIKACESCADTEALLEELVELSRLLTFEVHNIRDEADVAAEWGIRDLPTIAIVDATDRGVRFMGMPTGYEFSSLIETIIATGSGAVALTDETLAKLAELDEYLDIKTFSTPT